MELIKISSKGQLVIPAAIRKRLKIEPGSYLSVRGEENHIVLTPVKKGPLERLYGKYKGESILDDFERDHAEEISKDHRS